MLEDKIVRLNVLVDRFKQHIKRYTGGDYDEANLRVDFIDKFFEILDWDIANLEGHSEDYREVVREDRVRIEGKPKAPDYSFRIGKERKFFVEAKKPSVNIKEDAGPAFQVRRYGYSAKLPLSILTDFHEFAVYDTRIKPSAGDGASAARVFYCTYEEYETNFAFIDSTFSKNAIFNGSFDKYVVENKGKKGTSEVDREFLGLISGWREELAKNIALRNKETELPGLNSAVTKLIDRLIFLRIAEDRGTEEYGRLKENSACYYSLKEIFGEANEKYDSEIFKDDEFLNGLEIDDAVFKDIINGMYYPHCPYEFSVMPIEVLGNIYEQFLGKTIRLTAGHQAKIEEKPEVRKAGGVYYTPQYIVNYIVENTVGEKIKGKSPDEIASLRVLDPACGSGSFLIGAYGFLLDYHVRYYTDEKKRAKALKDGKIFQVKENDWHLTIEEKQKILINNIYGVDIDPQAVEVTKLSLLLKLMENETVESRGELFKHSALKLLPNLAANIKCGNSLIGSDFYREKDLAGFGVEEMRKVNVFDWEKEFPEIMKAGGFDCVIGNPPYTYIITEQEQEYFNSSYHHQDYQKDLYLLFLERYHKLLKTSGLLGVIISNTWLQSLSYQKIRIYLTCNYLWKKILHLPEKVFKAVVDTHVIIFRKETNIDSTKAFFEVEILKNGKINVSHNICMNDISHDGEPINVIADSGERKLFEKIKQISVPLSTLFHVYNGVKPFEKGKGNPPQTEKTMEEKPFVKEGKKPGKEWKPLLRGSLIHRYINKWDNDYWILYGEWLAAPRDPTIFEAPLKIMVRQTGDSIIGTLIEKGFIARNNLHLILEKSGLSSLQCLLGIINSKLIDFYYTILNPEKGEALAEVKKEHVENLPICKINSNDEKYMISLVDQMLETQKLIHAAKMEGDKKILQQKAGLIDRQIDDLVYKLYGLTEEEIRIVEGEK